MEAKLNEQQKQYKKALQTLLEIYELYLEKKETDMETIFRDSLVQRFEYCVDLSWKLLKTELAIFHGIELASPKSVYKEAFSQHMINEQEIWLEIIDIRNLLSHAYLEEHAQKLAREFPHYKKALYEIDRS
jgi:nucleotidyltransferase substrate binding protein (TIGR01987 family)